MTDLSILTHLSFSILTHLTNLFASPETKFGGRARVCLSNLPNKAFVSCVLSHVFAFPATLLRLCLPSLSSRCLRFTYTRILCATIICAPHVTPASQLDSLAAGLQLQEH